MTELKNVQREHAALIADLRARHLRPAAGRRPQIHHGHARAQQLVALRDFQQLERRARTIALRLRPLDVDIVDVLFHPLLAGFRSFHGVADNLFNGTTISAAAIITAGT